MGNCRVSWDPVPMAEFYIAYVKRDDGAESQWNTTGSASDFDCPCGYTYLSTVFAYNPSGSSLEGEVVNYTTSTLVHQYTQT